MEQNGNNNNQYIFFSNKRSSPRAKVKPFGVHFKEGQVDASLTLHKVKMIYSICHLRVSIMFDVIYQTQETVFHQGIQTPRRELKIRRAAEYF